jgi:hypothetical protein
MENENLGLLRKLSKELGITEEEAIYIIDHPCLLEPHEECSRFTHSLQKYSKILNFSNFPKWLEYFMQDNCASCINLNGFLVIKTGPNEKPRAVEKTMTILEEKCPTLYRFVKKKYNL